MSYEARLHEAEELAEDGRLDEAVRIYDEILAGSPRAVEALVNRAIALESAGRTAEALESVSEALRISPGDIRILLVRGTIMHSMQDYGGAISCYDIVLEKDASSPVALAYKGLALGELGKTDEAVSYFKRALAIDPAYSIPREALRTAEGILGSKRG